MFKEIPGDALASVGGNHPARYFSSKDNSILNSDGAACTVLELLLEPQWVPPSKGNGLEQPSTGKALIVMAFGQMEAQDTKNPWKPATRRISTQDVMRLYHRLPAQLRRRIASAYRAATEDVYSSEAAHIHLSFQFVHKRATASTGHLPQGWRVAEDFHLGRDSISSTFALAMSVPVEKHLLEVSKTMVYVTGVRKNSWGLNDLPSSRKLTEDSSGLRGKAAAAVAEALIKAQLARKRTRSGCLVCRKRRIKCGEERPVCKNCIKSKRHCEGYTQRVVFRTPTLEYLAAPNVGAHITSQAGPMAALMWQKEPVQMPYMLGPIHTSYTFDPSQMPYPPREPPGQPMLLPNEIQPYIGEARGEKRSPWDPSAQEVPPHVNQPYESMSDLPQIDIELENSKDRQQQSLTGDDDNRSARERTNGYGPLAGPSDLDQALGDDRDSHERLTSGTLQESPLSRISDLGDNESIVFWRFPNTGARSSQNDNAKIWSEYIKSRSVLNYIARVYPEIAEYLNQYVSSWGGFSKLPSRNARLLKASGAPVDKPSHQPLELEKKMDFQHSSTVVRKWYDSLESERRLRTERLIADLQSEEMNAADNVLRSLEQAQLSDRLAQVAFMFVPLSFAFSFLSMSVNELESETLLWISVLLALWLGVLAYVARKSLQSGLSRTFRQQPKEPPFASVQNPTIQRAWTVPTVKLHKLSGSILDPITEMTRQYLEPPVPSGKKRIRWQCRCGKSIYDDYFELKPNLSHSPADTVQSFAETQPTRADKAYGNEGALTDTTSKDLSESEADSSPRQHGNGSDQSNPSRGTINPLGSIWTSMGSMFNTSLKPGPTLPQHDTQNGLIKSTQPNPPPKPDHLEYLLLCTPFKTHANKLINIDTTTRPPSDKAFYRLLRQTYTTTRGRFRNLFSIRALSEIRFVQFEVFRNDLADVRKYDCIPPETQKDQYLYRPMPAEYEPPIGKNQMRHLYDHPEHADDLPVGFSRVPRKLRERLALSPGLGRCEGWGICFVEGVSWPRVCLLGLAGVVASTLFGVVWTVVRGDVQGGFGVASYMLGVLVLGLGALQGAFEV